MIVCAAFSADTARGQWVEEECEVLATAQGFESGALFGWLVTSADDADGDGVEDFAVAAPFGGSFRGRISVHSGADGSQIWSYTISYCISDPRLLT